MCRWIHPFWGVPMPEAKSDDRQLPKATGYPYTHYDCPHCGQVVQVEGDTRDEVIDCDFCGKQFEG